MVQNNGVDHRVFRTGTEIRALNPDDLVAAGLDPGSRKRRPGVGQLLPCLGAEQAADAKVTLKAVKFDEMTKTLGSLKGQVVVVDFWADT